MGLDMYLKGKKFYWQSPEASVKIDGFRLQEIVLALGYWRKHPNLHGYIVQAFAGGRDNCEEIELSALDLKNIISAVERDALPKTEGFFFGASDGTEKKADLKILRGALEWLEGGDKMPKLKIRESVGPFQAAELPMDELAKLKETRSVIYRASW